MPKTKLTDRQRRVLTFIKNYIHEKGYPPSMRDIADGMGFSQKAAFDYLRAIKKKGYITSLAGQPRTLRIPRIHALEVTENVEITDVSAIQIGDYLSIREQTSGTPGDIVITSQNPVVVKPFETGDVVCGKVVGFSRAISVKLHKP